MSTSGTSSSESSLEDGTDHTDGADGADGNAVDGNAEAEKEDNSWSWMGPVPEEGKRLDGQDHLGHLGH